MANNSKFVNPVSAAVGVAFVSSLAASSTVLADDNPFSTSELDAGYQLAGEKGKEGKCGEGKCGGDKGKDGACGEKSEKGKDGSCGEKGKDGSCGENSEKGEKGKDGSCGGNA